MTLPQPVPVYNMYEVQQLLKEQGHSLDLINYLHKNYGPTTVLDMSENCINSKVKDPKMIEGFKFLFNNLQTVQSSGDRVIFFDYWW
jgi:hypothetical protein